MGNTNLYFKVTKMTTTLPVVVILGCTGTGKSKLAIQLAKTFNGEIISADSMQVYKGLDIVTNKVSSSEQLEAVHHFISCTDPLSRYTVVDFRNKALPLIKNLLEQNILPIIVGGTNYYIESLLWDVLIQCQDISEDKLLFEKDMNCKKIDSFSWDGHDISVREFFKHTISQESVECITSKALHEMLHKIDPVMANSIHPQDRRKVVRSLQVFQQHGSRHSDLLSTQRSQKGGCSLGGPLRYRNSVMLWLQCEKQVLEKRLDDRMQQMIQRGLIDELLTFHKLYNEKRFNTGMKSSYSEGIFQSIGFKEFHEFLTITDEERNSARGEKIRQQAIERMRLITIQYAKKQVKWIANRFLKRAQRQLPPIYSLDATDVDLWSKNVLDPANHIVYSIINGDTPGIAALPVEEGPSDVQSSHFCEVCERVFVGERTWKDHLNSRKHSKRKASVMKKIQDKPYVTENNVQSMMK